MSEESSFCFDHSAGMASTCGKQITQQESLLDIDLPDVLPRGYVDPAEWPSRGTSKRRGEGTLKRGKNIAGGVGWRLWL